MHLRDATLEMEWGGVGCDKFDPAAHLCDATLAMGWGRWGGVGCDKFDQAAHLRDATQELSWGRVYCLSFCIRSIPTRCLFACVCA